MRPIRTKYAQRDIRVERDDHGVPLVTADSWGDALYGLGYMHALDRATQILFARTVAAGEAAERIADREELLETDRFFRRMGLHLNTPREVSRLSESIHCQIADYCAGVNDGLRAVGRTLPMWATRFEPQPWDHRAVLLVGNLLSFGGLAVGQMENERVIIELIHAGASDQAMRELFAPRLDECDFDLIRRVRIANKLSDAALELITDLPRLAGSNAWAVSPQRSATGGALLASDPHLEVNRLPAIWYEAVLRWGDRYVMGATLPGCPLFAVARTEKLAWGVTYLKADTIDYFVEDCRPGGATGWQYRRGRSWYDFARREEQIGRKDAEPQMLSVYENDLATLETSPDESSGEELLLSVAWAGRHAGSGRAIGTWLDVVAAADVPQAMDAVVDCPQPTLNWVFADSAGNIGMQSTGRVPCRGAAGEGLYPVPAWRAGNHWLGWLPAEALPRVLNPERGFVASANEDVRVPGQRPLCTLPLPDYRKRRIDESLRDLPAATIDQMQRLQYDVVSLQARDLLRIFLPHLPEGELKERLSAWDCRYHAESREATLFLNLYRAVLVEVLGSGGGIGWRRIVYLCSRMGYSTMVLTAADQLLARDDSTWWHGRDKGALIRAAAERAVAEGDPPWREVNNFHFTDRFFGGMHRVGRMLGYRSPTYAMPGNHATIFQGHVLQTAARETTFSPSYHLVTDLSTDQAWTNLPGGPSESRFSRFYKSGVPLWFDGEYRRLTCGAE